MKKDLMRNWLGYGAFCLVIMLDVLLLSSCGSRSDRLSTRPVQDPNQAFQQKMQRLRKDLKIPGMSVAIVRNQQVIYAEGYGYADFENKIPATHETPYNIASITKTFSAAVLMKLVEQRRLNLDDKIADILVDTDFPYKDSTLHGYAGVCSKMRSVSKNPFFRYGSLIRNYRCDTEKITVKHHLTHTSQGIPGETYRYNGFLFKFLTYAVQKASGKQYDELLVETIIAPLEMTRTVPSISQGLRDQTLANRAKYYRRGFWGHFVPSSYQVKLSASAGIVSTVLDLAKFDVGMDRNLIVSEETKVAMFTPTTSSAGNLLPYGLGWFVQQHKGLKLVWHYGYAPKAYSSLILKVPAEKITFILLANSDGASSPFNLGAGNVLKSPFAVAFLELFTDFDSKNRY
jgi:CubicO group peptidase (beta-lactamase class C family)